MGVAEWRFSKMNKIIVLTVLLPLVLCIGCSGRKQPMDKTLIGYWTFDELSANGEQTPDASGNSRHGRLHGQTLVDGVIGKAIRFEGYDQIIELGDLGVSAPVTVAFWVKTNDVFRDRRLFSPMDGPGSRAGALRFDGTQLEIWDGGAWQALLDRSIRINTWMHVAVVYDEGGKTAGYLNGVRQRLVRSGFDFNGVGAAIGAQFPLGEGNLFTGMLDDFRIYSRALESEEIQRMCSEQ